MVETTSWPERHLNISWLLISHGLSFWAAFLVAFVGALVIAPEGALFFGLLAGVAVFAWITIWYLRKKNRKLANLFWIIFPFGSLILLTLKNMSDQTTAASE
jgi:predicted membrane channel-forming protein YqfA (hemolysin III family)